MACPNCGGDLFRRFSFREKLALFLPVPYGRTCLLECKECGSTFGASTGITGYIITIAFALCMVGLGDIWWVAFVFLGAWLLISMAKSDQSRPGGLGVGHMLTAGVILGVLACIALVDRKILGDGSESISDAFERYGAWCVYLGVAFAFALAVIDRLLPPRIISSGTVNKRTM